MAFSTGCTPHTKRFTVGPDTSTPAVARFRRRTRPPGPGPFWFGSCHTVRFLASLAFGAMMVAASFGQARSNCHQDLCRAIAQIMQARSGDFVSLQGSADSLAGDGAWSGTVGVLDLDCDVLDTHRTGGEPQYKCDGAYDSSGTAQQNFEAIRNAVKNAIPGGWTEWNTSGTDGSAYACFGTDGVHDKILVEKWPDLDDQSTRVALKIMATGVDSRMDCSG
ncbi:MAG: hypothetical protein KGI68_14025 [Alphaproteobacteria bacterium]|nr:hypothetical protein [Alphaproteobacteria bacterium]MDE1985423.1 hypothetical protein [Alphaproteobacteria bacterium]MDE2161516.1 hypothetical protein [Alphaproteobacteria bacterium]MDE2266048.1 hypothetical protein [Alphaproteobacteria bacterium]